MAATVTYPARPQYFAHRFIRLMTKTAIAMELGAEGFALLTIISMQEDACRYTKPVSFWNSQLTSLMGMKSDHEARMRRVRDRCVEAGWLKYEAGGRIKPGRYFVTIPTHLNSIEDGACDESNSDSDTIPTLKRHQSDNETTLKRHQSDSFLTSPLPIPEREGETPAPSFDINEKRKADNQAALTKALLKQGLPAQPSAVLEWANLLTGLGSCKNVEEALNGLQFVLRLAAADGVKVQYAKHCRDHAWKLGERMEQRRAREEHGDDIKPPDGLGAA